MQNIVDKSENAIYTVHRQEGNVMRNLKLKFKRIERGMSQTELAQRMKVSRPYISKLLHQDVNFSFRTAAKLANALKMDFFPELRPQEEQSMFTNH